MKKKYIIELEDNNLAYTAIMIDGVPYIKPLQLLSYTEPDLERVKKTAHDDGYSEGYQAGREDLNRVMSDMEQIRKEAYQKGYETGYEDGYNEPGKNQQEAYQRGLSDAWEAARKLWEIDISTLHKIFYKETRMDCYMYYTATEAVAKIREYEDKQEEIKVWDEVKAFEKKPFIVTGFGYGDDEEDVYCYGFVTENGISTSAKKSSCVRTGRRLHGIDEVLEKMRGESNAQIDT